MPDNRSSSNKNSFHSSTSYSNNHQSPFLLKGENPHFKISKLYEDFEQNEFAIKELIEVAVTDLTELKMDLSAAFLQNNVAKYKQAHYRTLTTLKMIHASTLQDYLAQGRRLMESSEYTPEAAIFRNLEKEFSTVLTLLNALNPR